MTCSTQIEVEKVQALLDALQENNQTQAVKLLDELTQLRESELYQRLSSLTNNLHDTLDELVDNRLLLQTKHDLPDVTERLEYVLSSTDEACAKTLASTERAMELSESVMLLVEGHLDKGQAEQVQKQLNELNTELTNILLAQSFQDLTGQVLNRVLLTVSALEQSLIQLISDSRHDYDAIPDKAEDEQQDELKGIGPNVTQKSKQGAVDSQEAVDDLLGELGI